MKLAYQPADVATWVSGSMFTQTTPVLRFSATTRGSNFFFQGLVCLFVTSLDALVKKTL